MCNLEDMRRLNNKSNMKLTFTKFVILLQSSEWRIGITTFTKTVLNN